jgi:hypothetical protein
MRLIIPFETGGPEMHQEIRSFACQWMRIALAALVPVVLTAFVTIPLNLGRIPGDHAAQTASGERHMT